MIKRINEKKIEIDKLISKIGDKIVFILILGLMKRKSLSLREINVNNCIINNAINLSYDR